MDTPKVNQSGVNPSAGNDPRQAGQGGGGGQGSGNGGQGGGQPPQGAPPQQDKGKDLASSYLLSQINESFKSDRIFHGVISSKQKFSDLLSLIGKIPFKDRGQVARNLDAVLNLNPRLLQDTKVFISINTIMKNLPNADRFVQELTGKTLLKLREALIKNRRSLDLGNPVMKEYSEVIRKFLVFVNKKIKNDFFASLDEQIMNFILGKHKKKSKVDDNSPKEKNVKLFDDDNDSDSPQNRMDHLVSIIFNDVMRLEPELVSAAILSIITQLPHGNMQIEDQNLVKRWVDYLE